MVRAVRNKRWTNREDEVLRAAVTKYGKNSWGRVASMLHFTGRTAEQCETRWNEYLSPKISHREWTEAEDEQLLSLVAQFDSSWRTIAEQIPGRTPAQCQARHGFLLEQGTGGKTKFLQTDNRAEVQEAKLDAIDEDQSEKMMLDEVRARLANTQGRKGLRKQRERAALAAKQRTAVQRHREMRAATAAIDPDAAATGGGLEGNDDDDDFVPISTAEADYGRKAAEAHAKSKATGAASKIAVPPPELMKQAATPAAAVNSAVAGFSFASGQQQQQQQQLLRVPKALQDRQAKQHQQQVLAEQQKAKLRAAQQVAAQAASQQQQRSKAGVTDAVAAAIRDGGRTRRQNEALLRFGASASLPQWMREQQLQQQRPQGADSVLSQLPIPSPSALASLALRPDATEAERLVFLQAKQLAEADRSLNENATINESSKMKNSDSFFNAVASSGSRFSVESAAAWIEECASPEVAAAAKLVEEEFARSDSSNIKVDASSTNASTNSISSFTSSAPGAAALVDRITASELWRSAAKLHASVRVADAQKIVSDLIAAQNDAAQCRGAAAVAEQVRRWEEECLTAAYRRRVELLQAAKLESDAACAEMLKQGS